MIALLAEKSDLMTQLLKDETLFLLVAGVVGVVAIVFGAVASMVKSTARERSRREIAAYIAEGSMTPEQGERLMASGAKKDGNA